MFKIGGTSEGWALGFLADLSLSFSWNQEASSCVRTTSSLASFENLETIPYSYPCHAEMSNSFCWHPPIVCLLPPVFPSSKYPLITIRNLPANFQTWACGLRLAFCHVLFSLHAPPLTLHGNHWEDMRVGCLHKRGHMLFTKVPTAPCCFPNTGNSFLGLDGSQVSVFSLWKFIEHLLFCNFLYVM